MTSKCIILVQVLKSYNALALYFPFTKLGSLLGKYFIVLFIFAVTNFAPALLYSIFLGSGESVALGELHCVQCGCQEEYRYIRSPWVTSVRMRSQSHITLLYDVHFHGEREIRVI